MARSKFFSLWGQKNASDEEEEEKKPAEGSAAEEEQDDPAAESEDTEEEETSAEFDDEDDEEEDDEATQAEVAKVSRKAAGAIRRAERQRVHAIVKAAGPDRVEAGLQLALGTTLSVKDARVALAATTSNRAPTGGRLGLAHDMSSRRRPQLGAAAAPSAAGDTDKAAAFILKSGKV